MSRDHHHHGASAVSRLLVALALTTGFLVVEAIAGWWTGSLALLSDAAHMLTDAGALALAVFAQRLADRPRSARYTFGLRRAETLAALTNGAALAISALWVVVQAIRRFDDPPEIAGGWMLAVASVGLLVNLGSAWVLRAGGHNANLRAALAHVLADAAGSVAAMIAGALILWAGWARADAIVSLLISALILVGSFRLLRGTAYVLLERAPSGVDPEAIERTIRRCAGVQDVHDLHVWSIVDGYPVVTVHVVLARGAHGASVARTVVARVQEVHGIEHVTVQPEAADPPLIPAHALRR